MSEQREPDGYTTRLVRKNGKSYINGSIKPTVEAVITQWQCNFEPPHTTDWTQTEKLEIVPVFYGETVKTIKLKHNTVQPVPPAVEMIVEGE